MEQENTIELLSKSTRNTLKGAEVLFKPFPLQKNLIPRYKKLLGNIRPIDFLYHFPIRLESRTPVYTLNDILEAVNKRTKPLLSAIVRITNHEKSGFKSRNLRIHGLLNDETPIQILYFNGNFSWIEKLYPIDAEKVITGSCSINQGIPIFTHPDYVALKSNFNLYTGTFPIYSLSSGITQQSIWFFIKKILQNYVHDLPEWISPNLVKENDWPTWKEALKIIHNPKSDKDLDPEKSKAYQRLIYDEVLTKQLDILHIKKQKKSRKGKVTAQKQNLFLDLKNSLPFNLTKGQEKSIEEIYHDMSSEKPMHRLLQGDVGCGKTLVALSAAMFAIESGFQVSFLAPTEILARQHAQNIEQLCKNINLNIKLLLGGNKKNKKSQLLLDDIKEGKVDLVIGTHAIIEDSIKFKNLGLVIIDEQHRFGVDQRLKLIQKGQNSDILSMTATPIPRSLQMTLFSDMDLTTIKEKPEGRLETKTILLDQIRIEEVIRSLERYIKSGSQAYWVCPLIETSEKIDLTAAENRYHELENLFPNQVALVHGKMKSEERNSIIADFKKGNFSILVATTVIEVGIDIPKANLIIIEHAERFGLAQLHQLRGRVGRNKEKSYCFLIYTSPLSENAKHRLIGMRETNDGFLLAEKDLDLRGGGDIYGTQQSGYSIFKIANLARDIHLLYLAKQQAAIHLKDFEEESLIFKFLQNVFNKSKIEDYTKA